MDHLLKDLDSLEAHNEVLMHLRKGRKMVVATHLAHNMEYLIVADQVHLDHQGVDLNSEVMEVETETHCNLLTVLQPGVQAKMAYLEMD